MKAYRVRFCEISWIIFPCNIYSMHLIWFITFVCTPLKLKMWCMLYYGMVFHDVWRHVWYCFIKRQHDIFSALYTMHCIITYGLTPYIKFLQSVNKCHWFKSPASVQYIHHTKTVINMQKILLCLVLQDKSQLLKTTALLEKLKWLNSKQKIDWQVLL